MLQEHAMIVHESPVRDLLRLFFWYPVRWIIVSLPPNTAFALLRRMGDLHRFLSRGKKRALQRGLALAQQHCNTPGPQWERALAVSFRNHYVDRFVMFVAPRMDKDYVLRDASIQGLVHLDAALKRGQGAVVAIGHFGPVHMPLVCLALLGYPIQQIGMPSDKGLSWVGRNVAYRLRLLYESRMPAPIIHAEGSLKPILQGLRSNGVVMVTGDGTGSEQRLGRQTSCNFLGMQADFPLGPARLCQKTGAELLPMFILPGTQGRQFDMIIEEPLAQNNAERDDPALLACRFASRLEYYVGQCPGYMHFLDRLEAGPASIHSRGAA